MTAQYPDKKGLKIRPAVGSDLDRLVDLWRLLMQFHQELDPRIRHKQGAEQVWRDFAKRHMAENDRFLFVAEVSGEVVAYVMGSVEPNPPVMEPTTHGIVQDIYVLDDSRRQGVGTQLWLAALEWFRAKGQTDVELNVAALNPLAGEFWRSQGFADYLIRLHLETT